MNSIKKYSTIALLTIPLLFANLYGKKYSGNDYTVEDYFSDIKNPKKIEGFGIEFVKKDAPIEINIGGITINSNNLIKLIEAYSLETCTDRDKEGTIIDKNSGHKMDAYTNSKTGVSYVTITSDKGNLVEILRKANFCEDDKITSFETSQAQKRAKEISAKNQQGILEQYLQNSAIELENYKKQAKEDFKAR
jgi:hypothetical protein